MFDHMKKAVLTVAALAAFALGGAALAGAASKTSAKKAASGTTTQAAPRPRHGSAAHEDAEKPVTGDAAAKAQAAAEKSVGSGSNAGAVTTDFGGDGYEVTVTKADGSKVEVHLDKSFNVIQGHGGRGRHGFGGPEHGSAAHEDAEKPVTGDAAAKAQAAAEKSVGTGSNAGAVTTDFGGDGYEVTVTKADGSKVEVHLDKSFNVIQGHGGPGDHGRDGDGPDSTGSSTDGASNDSGSDGSTTSA